MEQYLNNFKNCLHKEIPYCAAECPFHLDLLDFIEKMKRGGFRGAFKTYRNAVGFPLIASTLCHEPCKGVCPRKECDSAIELGMLEKACVAFTEDRNPVDYNLPMKKKKVAIIGAGLSGLACALRLCMKKYEVEIYEKTNRIGGSLWELLEPEIFLTDIEEQLKHEKYALHLNKMIRTAQDLADGDFDAVYAATGQGGIDFGLISAAGETGDQYCKKYGNAGWFAGGGLTGDEPVYALANGLNMGMVIDNFLKTGNLLYPKNVQTTGMCLDHAKLKYEEPVVPKNGETFDKEEAQREAARCLECQCDFCRTYCDLTNFFHKWPLRIRDEILATTLPGAADIKATPAKRLMSTCSQCGLCKETCPEAIDLGGLILAGRKSMHRQKKAPWVFHDFWLRDMDFANSDQAAVTRMPKNEGPSGSNDGPSGRDENTKELYAFFPGCQLGANDPELVEKTYDYLLSKNADTGLLLRCCGAPVEWSGDEEKHQKEIAEIRKLWTELGKPVLILACPTCEKKFKTYMVDIPVVSLYEKMAEWGVDAPSTSAADQNKGRRYSVFDPCAARHESEMKEAVRKLAERAGCSLEPLPENDAFARCCGYGGQTGIANPDYTEFVTQKRISESPNAYITYCINCRDIFMDAGKEALHILDLILGDGKATEKLATVSERRENRMKLKERLLKRYWGEKMEEQKKKCDIKVNISSDLAQKLNRQKILEEDIIDVIDFCQNSGRRVYHPESRIYSGYREEGFMTYWVEYKETTEEGTIELINAYSHRMKIELEAVWNGLKTDLEI